MDEVAAFTIFIVVFLVIAGFFALLMPFFVFKIMNQVGDINNKLLIMNKNLSMVVTLLKNLQPYPNSADTQSSPRKPNQSGRYTIPES